MQSDRPLTAVVFDYSGVMTIGFEAVMPVVEELGVDRDLFIGGMADSMAGPDDSSWARVERGEMTIAAFADELEQRVPGISRLFLADSEHNLMRVLPLRGDRVALVDSIRRTGAMTALATNNVAEWQPIWRPPLGVDTFDEIIDSSDIGCRKPEAAFYEVVLTRLGDPDPSTVVFIDDFEWNVDGASQVGMVGIHCTASTDLRAELVGLGLSASAI